MSTVLAQAVEELSGSTAELPSALRRLMVIASRIKAPDLSEWVRNELNGYLGDTPVPEYRQHTAYVRLHFLGPFGSSRTIRVGPWDLPEALRPSEDWGDLRQSVAALAELREGENDPAIPLPAWWIAAARDLISKGEMVSVEMMGLDTADIVFARTFISSVLDQIQTEALTSAFHEAVGCLVSGRWWHVRVLGPGAGQGIVPAGAAGLRFSGSWVVVGTGSASAERGA